jgi:hypothetical protein
MSRRSFLFLAGAGTAGLLLAPSLPAIAAPEEVQIWQMSVEGAPRVVPVPNIGQIVAEAWNRIVQEPADNPFDFNFERALSTEMKRIRGATRS